MKKQNGFSLMEILIYVGILSIIALAFFQLLGVSTRVQVQQGSASEVSNQLNFTMQTIQRLIRNSSAIIISSAAGPSCLTSGDTDTSLGDPYPCLKLRMADPLEDPTCIFADGDAVKIAQGPEDFPFEHRCDDDNVEDLTTSKVIADSLTFTKFSNFPGHDVVEVNLGMSFASTNPASELSRSLITSVGKASAATFDTGLFPDLAGADTLDLGLSSTRWKELFVNDIDASGTIFQPKNYDGGARGMVFLGALPGFKCSDICRAHTGDGPGGAPNYSCAGALELNPDTNSSNAGATCTFPPYVPGFCGLEVNLLSNCATTMGGSLGGFCFCSGTP